MIVTRTKTLLGRVFVVTESNGGHNLEGNGKTWVSDIDNNVWEPGVYGWTEIE